LSYWILPAALAAGAAAWFIYFEVVLPFAHIRATLRALATRNFSTIILANQPRLFKGSAADIQKIAELLQQLDRQVSDEEFNLKAILSSMVEGVLIADRSHRIRLANDALTSLFSLARPPLSRTVIEVFRSHELQNALETALVGGQPQKIELVHEISSGAGGHQLKHFDVHIAGLTPEPDSSPTAALVVFHDVTRIRGLEAVRREFVANVSHEFRTPLAIITGYLETLLDGALDDRAMTKKSLDVIYKNTRRLSLLIDDLLSISRLEDRAKLLAFREENLKEILLKVLDHLEPNILEQRAGIDIAWDAGAEVAEVDGTRIEEVFSNLVGNALRHSGVEDLRIRIAASRKDRDVFITFADNGAGIPYDDQPHIFERFYRVHKDRSRDAGGTGLGLSIVKNVIQAHGGHVAVESMPGRGATFSVSLPLHQNFLQDAPGRNA